jgi:hypothetical protein
MKTPVPMWPESLARLEDGMRKTRSELSAEAFRNLYLCEPAPPLIDPNDPDYRWDDRTGRWVRRRNR